MKHTLSLLGLVIIAGTLRAEVAPVGIFSDHAVLQQGVAIPVWGRAKEGERVSVTFDGQTETTVAKDAKWLVRLSPASCRVRSLLAPTSGGRRFVGSPG